MLRVLEHLIDSTVQNSSFEVQNKFLGPWLFKLMKIDINTNTLFFEDFYVFFHPPDLTRHNGGWKCQLQLTSRMISSHSLLHNDAWWDSPENHSTQKTHPEATFSRYSGGIFLWCVLIFFFVQLYFISVCLPPIETTMS